MIPPSLFELDSSASDELSSGYSGGITVADSSVVDSFSSIGLFWGLGRGASPSTIKDSSIPESNALPI